MMDCMTSSAQKLKQAALKLPETDRLALALALWESMPEFDPEVGPDEADFAAKRLAEHRNTPDETVSWAESKRRLAKKCGL